MEKFNVSMSLQIAVKHKLMPVIAYSGKTGKVMIIQHRQNQTAFVYIDKEAKMLGEAQFCELYTDLGRIDESGEHVPSDIPMYQKVGTGNLNKTNVAKAFALIRKASRS